MHLQFAIPVAKTNLRSFLLNATTCPIAHEVQHQFAADCAYRLLGTLAPAFVIADYEIVDRAGIAVHFLHGHDASANNYADAAEKVIPLSPIGLGLHATKRKPPI